MSENLDFYKWFNNISSKLGSREISFKKNQILFFVKTHNSLHSVGPMENIDNHSLMRKSINFSIYQ